MADLEPRPTIPRCPGGFIARSAYKIPDALPCQTGSDNRDQLAGLFWGAAVMPPNTRNGAGGARARSRLGRHAGGPARVRSDHLQRNLLLGTVLIFVNCYWIIEVEGSGTPTMRPRCRCTDTRSFVLLLLVLFQSVRPQRCFPRPRPSSLAKLSLLNGDDRRSPPRSAATDSLQLGIPAVPGLSDLVQASSPRLAGTRFNTCSRSGRLVHDIEILKPLYYGEPAHAICTRGRRSAGLGRSVFFWCCFILALGTVA
jgi:hypothetical protein